MKLLLANPRKRATKKRRSVRRKSTGLVARVSRVTRRPRRALSRGFKKLRRRATSRRSQNMTKAGIATLKMGAIAGLGAVGADVLAAKLNQFLPVSMRQGAMQQVSQALLSIVAGIAIGKFNKQVGEAVAMGGVTVASYNLARSMLAGKGIPGIGDDLSGDTGLLAYNDGFAAYEMSGNEGLMAYELSDDLSADDTLSDDLNAFENGAPVIY